MSVCMNISTGSTFHKLLSDQTLKVNRNVFTSLVYLTDLGM